MGLIYTMEPVAAILLSALLAYQSLTLFTILGALCIIVAAVIAAQNSINDQYQKEAQMNPDDITENTYDPTQDDAIPSGDDTSKPTRKLANLLTIVVIVSTASGCFWGWMKFWSERRSHINMSQQLSAALTWAGEFDDQTTNGLMTSLVIFLDDLNSEQEPPEKLYVIADLACYGSLTYPDLYDRYSNDLKSLAAKGVKIKAVFYQENKVREVIGLQLPEKDWSAEVKDLSSQSAFKQWFNRHDVGDALLSSSAISPAKLNDFRANGLTV
jgi:hypothetical protein